jgi:hypothetical protein
MRTSVPNGKKILHSGDKCLLITPDKYDSGKIVIFLNSSLNGKYLFQSEDNSKEIFVCHDDAQFLILPTKNQLKKAIDLSLDIECKELFEAFSNDLLNGRFNNY